MKKSERNKEIIARRLNGETETSLAKEYGVTRQRISRLIPIALRRKVKKQYEHS